MSSSQDRAVALDDVLLDFILSRQAMNCSTATVRWYSINLGQFVDFLKSKFVQEPEQIKAIHVREHLSDLAAKGLSDNYIHGRARTIKTFVRFLHSEEYIPRPVTIVMPKLCQKRLKALTGEEVKQVLAACDCTRDKAIVSFLVDTGLRRAELVALNWADVNLNTGAVIVEHGKGGKARIAVMGVATRRLLLSYRRELTLMKDMPLFLTQQGRRFTDNGLRSLVIRISQKSGVEFSPHTLRRTFATLSLRAGMNPLHLQALMGHSTLDMVTVYVRMMEQDLLDAHHEHGPMDNLK